MKDKLGVAVVGLDNWYHAFPYSQVLGQLPNVRFVAISDANPEKARMAAARYGAERWSTDHMEVINDPAVDAIVLTVYTAAHADFGVQAINLGKHVLCDKPIEVSVEKAERLVNAAQAKGVTFAMSFPRRVNPAYVKARDLIRAGAIGDITCVLETGRWPLPRVEPDEWEVGWYADASKAGGGAFLDHAVHLVDALRFIIEDEAAEVQGMLAKRVHTQLSVEDYGIATIRFRRGVVATVESTWTVVPPAEVLNNLFIAGTKGDLTISRTAPQLIVHADTEEIHGMATFEFPLGAIIPVVAGHNIQIDIYRAVVMNFLDAVLTGVPVNATAVDGLAATQICEAVHTAAATGRTVKLA